ncbi:MAG: penicillin-binding transpeptidase domain-containing protein [Bacillota bacterium]|nr:penicillin-binding transpeptidase domain-containing protein [Bacillota bacterium]
MKKKRFFNRYAALTIGMLMLFSFMGYRLSDIQIINADYFTDRANTKAIRQIAEYAPRGKIIDKNGVVLAENIQSYNLIYMETDEGKEKFFGTFQEVFKILDRCKRKNDDGTESREQPFDELELKVNPYRFEFSCRGDDTETRTAMEILFKKNRGLDDVVRQKLFKDRTEAELTEEEKAVFNKELLKISPEEVFNYLTVKYDLWKLLGMSQGEARNLFIRKTKGEITDKEITEMVLKKYPPEFLRKFMLVKDAIYLQSFSGYKPVTVAANIDKRTAFLFEQVKSNLPGIDISLRPIRCYPKHELGSNFIGYISKINAASRSKYEERGYDISTDYIGTAGLESAFEDRLKGSKGGVTVRINKEGRKTEELFRLDPYPGQDMILTIDSKLQAVMERALNERMQALQAEAGRLHKEGSSIMDTGNATRGAAVVIDVNTGGILAMASLPGYDPNDFTIPGKLTTELRDKYFYPDYEAFARKYIKRMKINKSVDELFSVDSVVNGKVIRKDKFDIYPKPFYNYATFSQMPAGSAFKPLTAIAGLEEGVITPGRRDVIHDRVQFTVPGVSNVWSCYSKYGHGDVDIRKALEVSCNYYFYEVGNRLYNKNGLDSLAKYAWRFGLGVDPNSKAKKSTGIEISENFGQVFNYKSMKADYAFYSKHTIRDLLVSGEYHGCNGGGDVYFTPVDITENRQDSDALASAKAAVKAKVREYILADRKNAYASLKKELIPLFTNLINAEPENIKVKYKKSDPANMAEVTADTVVYDILIQVNTPGNIYNAAIGQGEDSFNPVQLANYIATFVNGGTRYSVHLVDKFIDHTGDVVQQYKPVALDKIDLKKDTIAAVKEGMKKVTDENGTAADSFVGFPEEIGSGGKTGSATFKENGVQESVGRTSYGLYVGFAPYDKPEIAVCVVIFDAGHGGFVSDVARAVYEAYFRDRLKAMPGFVPKFTYTLNP